jgi:hypothetical protein
LFLKRIIPILLLILTFTTAQTQSMSNLRLKIISTEKKSTLIDTLSIEPNSFWIKDVPKSEYFIDYSTATLSWLKTPQFKTVEVHYRVLSILLSADTKRMSFDSVMYKFNLSQDKITGISSSSKAFDFGKINSNGSLGRSLSFGNRQDAVLNSSLNLQLNGYIGDSILLSAAISDNNIPIQPDGNTQNLNEFDQVFIQFSKNKWKLNLGDFDIRQNDMYLLNFYKRLQGVSFTSEDKISSSINNKMNVSGAVAKGKFTRNVFQGLEGNQGPYRLKGANQELFFIVLAGTERIYIDGIMMQRGEDQDYVINYNTAEITFTPKQLISKDKRIQIEFEYADRNYLNSQIFLKDEISINEKFKVNIGFYNNGDAKNSPISQTLNLNQKQFLSNIGDNLSGAFYSSAVADTFSTDKILYKQIDTLNALNKRDTIYVYENKNIQNLFSLSFIDLGDGQGDYVQDVNNNANGKVYKWISPDPITGKKRGRFDPVLLIAAPKRQQLFSVATDWNLTKQSQLLTDIAFSNFDVNRFSSKDKLNDDGLAARMIFKNKVNLSTKKSISLNSDLHVEYNSSTFKPIERLRNVEFNRDWGLELINIPADEKLMDANFSLQNEKGHSLKYSIGTYLRNKNYAANRNYVEHQIINKSWRIYNQFGFTQFDDGINKGYFLRPTIDIAKTVEFLKQQEFGMKYTLEKNTSSFIVSKLLTPTSFSFSTFQIYTQSDQSKMDKWGLKYYTRTDETPVGKALQLTDRSHNFNFNADILSNDNHQFKINSTYRKLDILNSSLTSQLADNTFLGRAQYLATAWKGGINGDVLYELGTGQEPRRDFIYIEVPAGQGEYAWIDYNNDGAQQLNEFEIAKFKDQAKYFRITTPTNEFIKADYLQFNYNVVINPSLALTDRSKKGFIQFVKRLYFQSALQINQKQISTDSKTFNPFSNIFSDSTLISFDKVFSNSFSFNKFSQYWGLDINSFQASNRAYLSYGFETRANNNLSIKLRSNWFKTITVDVIGKSTRTILETPQFSNRNYSVKAFSFEPRITYIHATSFRIIAGYKIEDKKNEGPEKSMIKSLLIESKYNLVSNTSISAKFNLSNIAFNGNPNTSLGYIMLEGLLPGKNFIWTLDLTKRLSSFLEMSVQYEGRKAGNSGLVNIGRASVRAIL